MLVLTRQAGERIVISMGDTEVVLTVTQISRGKARIGVDAPSHVRVDREEISALRKSNQGEKA